MNKLFISIITIISLALIFTGCSLSNADKENEKNIIETEQEAEISSPSEMKQDASQTARYMIEFVAEWSSETHPDFYPSDAHFSPFIAYSHNNSEEAKIFAEGKLPTPGVEDMAETGKTKILIEEIQDIINIKNALIQTKGKRIDSPGNDSSELNFSQDFSYITFVSMLAPSPDWFVAGSINLFKDDQWEEKIEIRLITYDSGGDDGEKLTSKDKNSNPKKPISIFNNNLQNLGKIILKRIDS